MKLLSSILLCGLASAIVFAAPVLRLSETTIGPVSIPVGQNGPTRSVEYSNIGDGSLNVSFQSSASWAVAAAGPSRPCSVFGAACTPINVSLNTAALAKGTYTAAITVRDPNALDAPQTITVTVVIGGSVPDSVKLYISPDAGSRDSVKLTANGVLDGTPTTQSGGSWLSLAFEGQGSFDFVLPYAIVARNPGNIAEGTYNGSLRVASGTQPVDNKTVAATLVVTSQPILALSAPSVTVRTATGTPEQFNYVLASNRGRGTLALSSPTAAVTSGAGWLAADIYPGTNYIQIKTTVGDLAAGTYEGTVTVNSNAVNGPLTIPVRLEVATRGNPVAVAGGVVNNATFARGDQLGRGTIAAVFGEQFIFTAPVSATSLPLGPSMGGVRVLVNNVPAPVYYVSYGQINFQIPYDAAEGNATVVVESNGLRSNGVTVPIASRAPRLLRLGIGEYGIVVNPDGTYPLPRGSALGAAGRPVRVGETIVMYAIGLGPTTPAVASGAGAPTSPLAQISPLPGLIFGSQSISLADATRPLFVGLTPNFVGLYQINVTIPAGVEKGPRVPVFLNMGNNVFSNTVELAIE